jgi:cell division protein FtsL
MPKEVLTATTVARSQHQKEELITKDQTEKEKRKKKERKKKSASHTARVAVFRLEGVVFVRGGGGS